MFSTNTVFSHFLVCMRGRSSLLSCDCPVSLNFNQALNKIFHKKTARMPRKLEQLFNKRTVFPSLSLEASIFSQAQLKAAFVSEIVEFADKLPLCCFLAFQERSNAQFVSSRWHLLAGSMVQEGN